MKALLYLNIHLLRNTIMRAIVTPKVVVPTLFMAVLFGLPLVTLGTLELPQIPPPFTTETAKPVIFSFLTFITWVTVIHSTTKSTLVFSLPEIDFLFPSPLKRKTILLNRMIVNFAKMALQYLGMAGLMLFIMTSVFAFSFWPRILFLWTAIVLIIIFASNLGDLVSLISSHYSELSRYRNRKIVMVLALLFLALILGFAVWYTAHGVPLTEAITQALNSSEVRIVMYPMAAASDVAVSRILTFSVGSKVVLLLVLCLTTTWAVLSVETHFYEASEVTSRELWESVQKMRRQEVVVSESFVKKVRKIKPFGTGSTVLIWKNMVGLVRDIRSLVPTVVMTTIFFAVMVVRGGEFYSALSLLFFLIFITTNYIRWDFRQDLKRIEIIKLIPDSDFKIVLSEIAVPCIFSTLISYFFLGLTFFIFPHAESRLPLTGFSLAAIPLFSVIMITIVNLSALYYPPQTSSQVVPGILSLVFMIIVVFPSLMLGMVFYTLGMLYVGLLVVLLVSVITVVILLKLLARKYRGFDLTD
jgi:hypothetical protein